MLTSEPGRRPNRLIHESSPYLLQHAYNPVDWLPWGREALERARREDKPIFLSIGYSTCHWCHVMAHECFEHEDVAALLNEGFVAVKVDREERPDVDAVYMTATELVTGRGGWPNSVWLTPDGRPWYAGTYFPREDHAAGPGFKTLLRALAALWRSRRADIERQADRLAEAMRRIGSDGVSTGTGELSRAVVEGAIRSLEAAFDPRYGGFDPAPTEGPHPKFPPHASLRLILYEFGRTRSASLEPLFRRTLDAMAMGGIHDHMAGGFHRYSTDARWFLPHFEKMLYDNAQMIRNYADAYRLTGDPEYRRVAVNAADWLLREMTDAQGGFYAALDADSQGQEGRFYLWRPDEIVEVLGEADGQQFCRLFGIVEAGNFVEEATGHRPGASLLHLTRSLPELAVSERRTPEELRGFIETARQKLLGRRNERPRPPRDDKVLAGWNGLTIGSLARAGHILAEPRHIEAAERAARFLLTHLRPDGRLRHSWRQGQARLEAFLDDYALLADGLLDLHEATGEASWAVEAQSLVEGLLARYWDADGGGFFLVSSDHQDLFIRSKDPIDQAAPSGNGAAAQALVRLAAWTGQESYRQRARQVLEAFRGLMEQAPLATPSLILAAALYFDTERPGSGPAPPASGADSAAVT